MRYTLRRPRAFWISTCNVIGLFCSLAGVLLLFWFALPVTVPRGPVALGTGGGGGAQWEAENRRYNRNARVGLILVIVGTLMEAVLPIYTACGSARRRVPRHSTGIQNELQELLDMFAVGSDFGDPDARSNAEQRFQFYLRSNSKALEIDSTG